MQYKVENGSLNATAEVTQGALRVKNSDLKQYLEVLRATRQEAGNQIVLKKS